MKAQKISFAQKYPNTIEEYSILNTIHSSKYVSIMKAHVKGGESRTFCIKKIDQSCPYKNDYVHESEILRVLNHKNIIKLYHTFYDQNFFFMVFDYCDGGSLAGDLNSRKSIGKSFSEQEVFEYALQMFSALMYLHSKGFCHRNITIESFLINDGYLKICNWRECVKKEESYVDPNTKTPFETPEERFGNPLYMTPEVIDFKNYNFTIDCWSSALCLMQLCNMEHPFSYFHSLSDNTLKFEITNNDCILYPIDGKIENQVLIKAINGALKREIEERLSSQDIYIILDKEAQHYEVKLKYYPNVKKISSNSSLFSIQTQSSDDVQIENDEKYVTISSTSLHFDLKELKDKSPRLENVEEFFDNKAKSLKSSSFNSKKAKYLTPRGIEKNAHEANKKFNSSAVDLNNTKFEDFFHHLNTSLHTSTKVTVKDFMQFKN